ncbi:MAG TPA: SUMF1/EgtB/PvdO family nonheme iron enzyme [Candidatus Binatia bacterium]|nr:SUMF1/EgtB/PvdO family nonheme iron enzyme [Candidatus Binatia bacterium]
MALPLRRSIGTDKLRDRLSFAWARTDDIFAILTDDALSAAPIVWRHPFIFYLGHLPAFAWNQICGALLKWPSINGYFEDLFCRGIDPDVDTGECHWHPEVPEMWPSAAEVLEYRDRVRLALKESVEALSRSASSDVMAQHGRVFEMILEHEFMHQETLMYMLQQLPLDQKHRPRWFPRYSYQCAAVSQEIAIPAGTARLGAQFDDQIFGWDNEFGEAIVPVPQFTIDSLPVSNGRFFDFVDSGAYENEDFWRAEDWRWKTLENKHHPTSWFKRGDSWYYRAMFDVMPLELVAQWPVYVSLAEARAYARWIGKRLPSEAEYHRAAFYGPGERESEYPWGNTAPALQHGNFDFVAWSAVPVGSRPAGSSRWGVLELVGNGWELTDTPFAPFPNFSPYIASYPDYSRDFFDGKHFVLKGASWATPVDLVRPAFRNWYQAHYPYVFAKFRCVSD